MMRNRESLSASAIASCNMRRWLAQAKRYDDDRRVIMRTARVARDHYRNPELCAQRVVAAKRAHHRGQAARSMARLSERTIAISDGVLPMSSARP